MCVDVLVEVRRVWYCAVSWMPAQPNPPAMPRWAPKGNVDVSCIPPTAPSCTSNQLGDGLGCGLLCVPSPVFATRRGLVCGLLGFAGFRLAIGLMVVGAGRLFGGSFRRLTEARTLGCCLGRGLMILRLFGGGTGCFRVTGLRTTGFLGVARLIGFGFLGFGFLGIGGGRNAGRAAGSAFFAFLISWKSWTNVAIALTLSAFCL